MIVYGIPLSRTRLRLQYGDLLKTFCQRVATYLQGTWLMILHAPSAIFHQKQFNIWGSRSNVALLFITLWAIWSFRNRLVLENVLPALDSYVLFIRNYAAEYTTSQLVLNQPSHPSPPHWNPSSGNLIKVNFDVAFDTNSFSSSSGIVFRNNKGLLMAAAVFPHSHVLNSCAVEAQACLDVVSLAHELSFHNIIIEGDSLTVIKKLNSASTDRSLISMFISDIKHLSEGFESITFNFVN
ncbi:hypothetical protein V6N12_032458 [Hibiscus sabdariffa]|uniref:RNase H type-1 domain-containing protein n=1 Tax=Hibiscus sabdariffa TaxID=183260 RepID=A0ABR2CCM7_9ROSI